MLLAQIQKTTASECRNSPMSLRQRQASQAAMATVGTIITIPKVRQVITQQRSLKQPQDDVEILSGAQVLEHVEKIGAKDARSFTSAPDCR
jgi:hypothetical protein